MAAEGYTAPYAGPAPCGKRCSQPRPPPQDAGPPPEGSPPTRDLPACRRAFRVRQSRSIRRRALPWAADLTSSARLLLHAEGPPRTLREKTKKKPCPPFPQKNGAKGAWQPCPGRKLCPTDAQAPFPPCRTAGERSSSPFCEKKTLSAVSCSRCYTIFFSPGASLQESRATESAARGLQPQTGRHE